MATKVIPPPGGSYIVKVNGEIALKTTSESKAKKLYDSYIGKNGKVTVGSVELLYP